MRCTISGVNSGFGPLDVKRIAADRKSRYGKLSNQTRSRRVSPDVVAGEGSQQLLCSAIAESRLQSLPPMKAIIARLAIVAVSLWTTRSAWAGELAPGDYRFEVDAGGRRRSYLVHVPHQAVREPLPVVLSLHGGGGNARQHRQSTGMDAAADRDGHLSLIHISEPTRPY